MQTAGDAELRHTCDAAANPITLWRRSVAYQGIFVCGGFTPGNFFGGGGFNKFS
jgi:hypothetical protein